MPGVGAGAGGDVGPALGDDPAGRLPAVGGHAGRHGDDDAAGRDDDAGRDLLGRHGGDHVRSGQGQSPTTTIPVQVRLTDPGAAGTLDQAPVTVNITTESSPGPVLAVPVTALVAQSPGGYVVEVVGPGNTRR